MIRMRNLWRHPKTGKWFYSCALPVALKGRPVPPGWPATLADLRAPDTPTAFRKQWRIPLHTRDGDAAAATARRTIAPRVQAAFDAAAEWLRNPHSSSPPLPALDIASLAAAHYRDRLADDEAARKDWSDITRDHEAPDLHLDALEAVHREIALEDLEAARIAQRRRNTTAVATTARVILGRATGRIPAPADPLVNALAGALLDREGQAAEAIVARNSGAWIDTPPAPVAPKGPTLSEALEAWAKQKNAARPRSIGEARRAVTWFCQLHGDLPVASIKRPHVRAFRDATAALPSQMSSRRRLLPLPRLIEATKGTPPQAQRSAKSVNKHLALLSGVANYAASEHDLADEAGWTNPFLSARLATTDDTAERRPFALADLRSIFSHPIITGLSDKPRPKAARGEAAKFIPLIGLFSGARLDEICQMRVKDLRRSDAGLWLFDHNSSGEAKHLKNAASRRIVPVHAELIACGLLEFHSRRLAQAGPEAPLFAGFSANRDGKWSTAFSKFFTRFLRHKVRIADESKVFHSFRHTFAHACDNAEPSPVPDALRNRLMGHSRGGNKVAAGYNAAGFGEKALAEAMSRIKFDGLDLSHLHAAMP